MEQNHNLGLTQMFLHLQDWFRFNELLYLDSGP